MKAVDWATCPECFSTCKTSGEGVLIWECDYCKTGWSEIYLQAFWIGYRTGVKHTKGLSKIKKGDDN